MLVPSQHFSNEGCFGRKFLTGLCNLGILGTKKAIKMDVSSHGDTWHLSQLLQDSSVHPTSPVPHEHQAVLADPQPSCLQSAPCQVRAVSAPQDWSPGGLSWMDVGDEPPQCPPDGRRCWFGAEKGIPTPLTCIRNNRNCLQTKETQ